MNMANSLPKIPNRLYVIVGTPDAVMAKVICNAK